MCVFPFCLHLSIYVYSFSVHFFYSLFRPLFFVCSFVPVAHPFHVSFSWLCFCCCCHPVVGFVFALLSYHAFLIYHLCMCVCFLCLAPMFTFLPLPFSSIIVLHCFAFCVLYVPLSLCPIPFFCFFLVFFSCCHPVVGVVLALLPCHFFYLSLSVWFPLVQGTYLYISIFCLFLLCFFIHRFALCSLYVPSSLCPIHFLCPFPGFVFCCYHPVVGFVFTLLSYHVSLSIVCACFFFHTCRLISTLAILLSFFPSFFRPLCLYVLFCPCVLSFFFVLFLALSFLFFCFCGYVSHVLWSCPVPSVFCPFVFAICLPLFCFFFSMPSPDFRCLFLLHDFLIPFLTLFVVWFVSFPCFFFSFCLCSYSPSLSFCSLYVYPFPLKFAFAWLCRKTVEHGET